MLASLVDFHCHLDLYPDYAEAIADCERAGIYTLAVTTTPQAWPRNRELTSKTKFVRAALGLHPQLVAERGHEISLWESYLPEARYIGEVGIDAGPRYFRSLQRQKEVFERVLQCCANAGDKILSVHSVRAATLVLDLIAAHLPRERGRTVLHWFTGTSAEVDRALGLGCLFSVNLEMVQKKSHRNWISQVPLDSLLTETDGPFTHREGRHSRSSDVVQVIEEIARIRELEPAALRRTIAANLRRLVTL